MKDLKFASEEEAIQHLADISGKQVLITAVSQDVLESEGKNVGISDVPDACIAEEDTEEKPEAEEEAEAESTKDHMIDDATKLTFEQEGDQYKVVIYKLSGETWRPSEAYYDTNPAKMKKKFKELKG